VASIERVSLHWPHRHNFCALLRNRPALVDAPIHRMDSDDCGLFQTRLAVRGDSANVRRRASVFALPRRECRQEFGKEI